MTTATDKMANLTWGTELELIGIDRAGAAEAVRSVVGGQVRYTGGGYDVVEVVAADGRVWKCMRDGSLSSSMHAEVVTPIMKGIGADLDTVQAVVRACRAAGARVDGSCGQHVHVGTATLDAFQLAQVVRGAYHWEKAIHVMCGVQSRRTAHFCKPLPSRTMEAVSKAGKKNMMATGSAVKTAWYGDRGAHLNHYDDSRYHGVNLHSVFYRGTIEFRWFEGTTHAGEVKANVVLALALVAYGVTAKRARVANGCNMGVDKWLANYMLRQLGLTGPEMKNVREHLTKRVPATVAGTVAA